MHAENPDARPHLLVTLLLQTGIKKSECMAIQLNDIDTSEPQAPVLYIRYTNPKMKHKERKLGLPADFVSILHQYLAEYQPKERLFECTARNLEYVLDNVARLAGLDIISFEILRWTSAVRDHKSGMLSDKLRQKLGLSKISWQETSEKLKKLASPPL
jgi:integrase/recombinase XerD